MAEQASKISENDTVYPENLLQERWNRAVRSLKDTDRAWSESYYDTLSSPIFSEMQDNAEAADEWWDFLGVKSNYYAGAVKTLETISAQEAEEVILKLLLSMRKLLRFDYDYVLATLDVLAGRSEVVLTGTDDWQVSLGYFRQESGVPLSEDPNTKQCLEEELDAEEKQAGIMEQKAVLAREQVKQITEETIVVLKRLHGTPCAQDQNSVVQEGSYAAMEGVNPAEVQEVLQKAVDARVHVKNAMRRAKEAKRRVELVKDYMIMLEEEDEAVTMMQELMGSTAIERLHLNDGHGA
ncbi:hypothetical protein M011DRAFT_475101 [Sporormia fimetaria CBS 119925]|uniref:Uncharacterized protein n=1 Tax=Sporormia fimetaria CBS 119925 TaxID=1340428 RepID=A0A6A6VGL8_9PLEO|nr:hypothetical protein M011DRAFT_475101 [Sporormia fimetaria CBS 119925]